MAKQLAAIRQLALALGVQGVGRVKSEPVEEGVPRPLSQEQYARLLKMPDRRTTRGKRDLALLHLLGTAGLRRQEATDLRIDDIEERRRAPDGRLRAAIVGSPSFWVVVRRGKRAHRREIPLDREALEAIEAWYRARPTCGVDELLVSLPRRRQEPRKLGVRDVGRIVAHYGALAELPQEPVNLRTPHTLRHTFCSHLVASGVEIDAVRKLAGHVSLSTTQIYVAASDERLVDAIQRGAERGGLRGLARTAAA